MNLTLDHFFIVVKPNAAEAERLIELGFTESPSNHHPGQGTANRRFYFANTMLDRYTCRSPSRNINHLI